MQRESPLRLRSRRRRPSAGLRRHGKRCSREPPPSRRGLSPHMAQRPSGGSWRPGSRRGSKQPRRRPRPWLPPHGGTPRHSPHRLPTESGGWRRRGRRRRNSRPTRWRLPNRPTWRLSRCRLPRLPAASRVRASAPCRPKLKRWQPRSARGPRRWQRRCSTWSANAGGWRLTGGPSTILCRSSAGTCASSPECGPPPTPAPRRP
mmetsp:Transcript_7381/g.22518  ORF Transcript_7381/g.22518 Transcript_7381/m.22518 type:complete len:204 (-) Transcript_7381:1189-1800(-)